MALLDRFGSPGNDSIASHEFSAACYYWTLGDLTRAQIVAAFEIQPDEEVHLDQLQEFYVSLSVEERRTFHSRLEAALVLLEGGHIPQSTFKSLLGLT